MIDEQIRSGTRGLVVCTPEQNGFELDGHLLQEGEWLELRVFGLWIAGQEEEDSTGCYLLPPDGVGIRLRAGLPARLSEGSIAGAAYYQEQVDAASHPLSAGTRMLLPSLSCVFPSGLSQERTGGKAGPSKPCQATMPS